MMISKMTWMARVGMSISETMLISEMPQVGTSSSETKRKEQTSPEVGWSEWAKKLLTPAPWTEKPQTSTPEMK